MKKTYNKTGLIGRPYIDGDERITQGFNLHVKTIDKLRRLSKEIKKPMGRILDDVVAML